MSELKIELIAVGDEILIGHTLDTNSNWIATRLSELGFPLRWISVIGDNADSVIERFLTMMPHRISVGKGKTQFNSVLINVDEKSGRALSIERIDREVEEQ